MGETPSYWSRSQIARLLGVSKHTIMRWERDGLPVIKVGQKRLYDITDVRAWLEAHKVHHSEGGEHDAGE